MVPQENPAELSLLLKEIRELKSWFKDTKETIQKLKDNVKELNNHPVFTLASDGVWLFKIKLFIKAIPYVLLLLGMAAVAGYVYGIGWRP